MNLDLDFRQSKVWGWILLNPILESGSMYNPATTAAAAAGAPVSRSGDPP